MWYALYVTSEHVDPNAPSVVRKVGELYSIGTVIADPLPKWLGKVELGEDFDQEDTEERKTWNPKTLTFDLKPLLKTRDEVFDEVVDTVTFPINTKEELKQLLEEKL